MFRTDGSITTHSEDSSETENFLMYDEEEKQNNEINSANAKLIFSPKFIPFYPELIKMGLSVMETVIFGFIDFYKSTSAGRFYFTNEQIAEIVGCNPDTVSRVIIALESRGLISASRKRKAGGGLIRFVNDVLYNSHFTKSRTDLKSVSEPTKSLVANRSKVGEIYNKINNNKIKGRELSLKVRDFHLRKDIDDPTLSEISETYGVPLDFVRDCWDSAQNWCDAKGKIQKNYKAFLSNWVKRERANLMLRGRSGRGGVVDVRTK